MDYLKLHNLEQIIEQLKYCSFYNQRQFVKKLFAKNTIWFVKTEECAMFENVTTLTIA
jgi:hypothetical protein